jgi:hypothetical protein
MASAQIDYFLRAEFANRWVENPIYLQLKHPSANKYMEQSLSGPTVGVNCTYTPK